MVSKGDSWALAAVIGYYTGPFLSNIPTAGRFLLRNSCGHFAPGLSPSGLGANLDCLKVYCCDTSVLSDGFLYVCMSHVGVVTFDL